MVTQLSLDFSGQQSVARGQSNPAPRTAVQQIVRLLTRAEMRAQVRMLTNEMRCLPDGAAWMMLARRKRELISKLTYNK